MVIINPLPLAPAGGRAYNHITPFTYRDGLTYIEVLENLRAYIRDVLVPHVDNSFDEIEQSVTNFVTNLQNFVDTAIADNKEFTEDAIGDLTTYVNSKVQSIINNSIEVQDSVVAGIFNDTDSASRTISDNLYADKDTQNTVNSGRLSENTLNEKFIVNRVWDGSTYPARIATATNIFIGGPNPGSAMTDADIWISPNTTAPSISDVSTNAWRLRERWAPVVERVVTGAGHAKVLCIGDSTTWGTGVSGAISPLESYPSEMARRMVQILGPTVWGLAIPPSDNRPDSDSRWVLGAGWARATESGVGLGGRYTAFKAVPNSGELVFTDGRINANAYDIYYTINPSTTQAGKFTAHCGGEIITTNTMGTKGVGKVTVTGPSSISYGVRIATTSDPGSVWILGVTPHDGSNRFRVGNAGVAASSTASWLTGRATEGDAWNVFGFLKTYQPDLTIIDLGINDAPSQNPATVAQRIKSIADAAYDEGSAVLLKTMIPSRGETGEVEKLYVNELKKLSYPLLDIYSYFGSWERSNAMGLMSDWGHGNDYMYEIEGRIVADFLKAYSV